MPPTTSGRDRRSELLALADRDRLVDLADQCLARGPQPVIVSPPDIGMVLMEVREPVEQTRFQLGEVLVTRAEVELHGQRGWSLRMGGDRMAALAAAICDAEAEGEGTLAGEVADLCRQTEIEHEQRRDREWQELAPTEVSFEELD
jgi:alpha-D-ribose 1-methylphosphonate 5-triphosphate synthase subunit PhnG